MIGQVIFPDVLCCFTKKKKFIFININEKNNNILDKHYINK